MVWKNQNNKTMQVRLWHVFEADCDTRHQ